MSSLIDQIQSSSTTEQVAELLKGKSPKEIVDELYKVELNKEDSVSVTGKIVDGFITNEVNITQTDSQSTIDDILKSPNPVQAAIDALSGRIIQSKMIILAVELQEGRFAQYIDDPKFKVVLDKLLEMKTQAAEIVKTMEATKLQIEAVRV